MSFFYEINVTELRDGITSLHGIHANQITKAQEVFVDVGLSFTNKVSLPKVL